MYFLLGFVMVFGLGLLLGLPKRYYIGGSRLEVRGPGASENEASVHLKKEVELRTMHGSSRIGQDSTGTL